MTEPKPTSEKIATATGVTPRTVERDAKFSEAVDAIEEVAPGARERIINEKAVTKNEARK